MFMSPLVSLAINEGKVMISGLKSSSGRSSWLQIQRSRFDSRHYHISREVDGLERGILSIVSTTEELLGRKSSGSDLQNRDYGRRDPPRSQKLALTSLTSAVARSV
jgi:hypothetical protein